MKKLGLCACYNHKNYGSQLQSYATTVELKKRNIDYEIIRYKKKITPLLLTKAIPRLFNPVFINDRIIETFQKKLMLKLHSQLAEQNAVRNDAFNKFSENRFKKLSPIYYGSLKRFLFGISSSHSSESRRITGSQTTTASFMLSLSTITFPLFSLTLT